MPDLKPTLRKQNTQSPVILMAVVALGLIAGVFYYLQVLRDNVIDIPPANIPAQDNLIKFNSLLLDFSVFDNPRFKSLKIFGESPVRPDKTGKNNLFTPF